MRAAESTPKENPMQLKDKVAIVTGAASGFGAEIARQYVAEGARVAVADINAEGAREVAASLGASAIAVTCDITQRADIDALVAATTQAFGRLDIVVNNAGWTHRNQPLLDVTEAEFDKVYAINVKSIFHMTHAVVPPWIDLVQQFKRCGEPHEQVARRGAGAGPDPRQRHLPGDGRDGPVGELHGHARHAREPQEVHCHDSDGKAVGAARHCAGGGVSGE
jgi:NAD(P)-dependent dehydrogenase (short-subunit alcohol dehydrogenase family)